ncbi:MAG TPA: radical SAM protein [Candidatus Acidoferrum sp.]|nr:radical SAM protein [Candidatus Acidoferrum sp.]
MVDLTDHQRRRRVLFLNANETARPYRVAPIGLAFVATATERAGHDVRLVDLPQTRAGHRQFVRALRDWRPDFLALGIRNLDNSDYHALETYLAGPARLIREARQLAPRATMIVGGPAGTIDPERMAAVTKCDHLVLGEGEESLPQLIARLSAGQRVPRIFGADPDGTPFRVANPAALPAPALYRWVNHFAPYLRGDAGYPVQTKRGCPLRCTYCTYGRIEGERYRFLNPTAIAAEIEGALARGIRDIEFVDSTFNLPVRHALEVLRTLRARGLQANYIGTGLNPRQLPDELLETMHAIGFRSVILTAESASDTMLANYQKNYRRDRLLAAAESLQRHGIRALWIFLLGGPGETRETVEQTLSFIAQYVPSPNSVYITSGVRIYPGSRMNDEWDRGRLDGEHLRRRFVNVDVPFYYSRQTPPEWLEARLREFQHLQPQVMLSCEGHAWLTQAALWVMQYLPVNKPYWHYIPTLNTARRWMRWPAMKPSRPAETLSQLSPVPQS